MTQAIKSSGHGNEVYNLPVCIEGGMHVNALSVERRDGIFSRLGMNIKKLIQDLRPRLPN